MDLEKAYNKIDNLCCFNNNESKYWQDEYGQWVNFFQSYSQTHDDNFCKDANEMVEALETIKEVVDLQNKLGCSLVSFIKIISLPYNSKNQIYDEFGNVWIVDRLQHTYNNPCLFEVETHIEVLGEIKYNYFKINEYKKNWWLNEDRSE